MPETLEFIIQAKDNFSKSFKGLFTNLYNIKAGFDMAKGAAVFASKALFSVTTEVANAYDKYSKLSDQLGVSTEFLSKLNYQAKIGGVEWNTAEKAIQKFQVGIGEAAQGIGTAKDSFAGLGVQIYDANGQLKTSEQLLPEVADALSGVQNATERAEIAQKLFGQRGISMLQIMIEGSSGMNKLATEAENMGLVVSDVAGKQAAAFNDSLTRAQGVVKGLREYIGVQFMPVLTGLATKFSEFVTGNRDKIIDFGKAAIKAIGEFAEKGIYGAAILIDSFRGLQMLWESIKIGFAEMSKGLWQGIDWLTQKMLSFMKTMNFKGIFDEAIANIESFSEMSQENIDAMTNMSQNAYSSLMEIANQATATEKVEEYKEYIITTIAELDELGRVNAETKMEREDMQTQNLMLNLQARNAAEKASLEESKKIIQEEADRKQKELEEYNEAKKEATAAIEKMQQEHDVWELEQERNKSLLKREWSEEELSALSTTKNKVMNLLRTSSKKEFKIFQALGSAEAAINAANAATAAYKALAGVGPFGPVLGAAAAAAALAYGYKRIQDINSQKFTAAHGGYTNVPKEQTMLIDEGERILSPNQNRDFTEFMQTGGGGNQTINVSIMPNVTNPDVLLRLDRHDWDNIVESNIIPSMRRLKSGGIEV